MASNIPKLIVLDDAAITKLIKHIEVFSILTQCLIEFSKRNKTISQPLRTRIDLNDSNDIFFSMPAYYKDNFLGIKLLSLFPGNTSLPSINGVIVLFDEKTGAASAILDAAHITGIRTSAISAIATQQLASEDSRILSIIGTGFQAEHHIESHIAIQSWQVIHIIGNHPYKVQALIEKMSKKYPHQRFNAVSDKKTALLESDVICTLTTSKTPVLSHDMLKPHCHINCIGAASPNETELDKETMIHSKVVTDSLEAAYKESGDVILSGTKCICELGQLLENRSLYAISRSDLTVFKSLGMAVEDVAVSRLVMDKYAKLNL